MSDLLFPIATDRTKRNNSDETIGDKRVCIQTLRNLKTSFCIKCPQTNPVYSNQILLYPILYFLLISTIRSLITSKNKFSVKNFFFKQI